MEDENFNNGEWTVVGKKSHGRKNKSTFNNYSTNTNSNQHGDHQDWTTTTIDVKILNQDYNNIICTMKIKLMMKIIV